MGKFWVLSDRISDVLGRNSRSVGMACTNCCNYIMYISYSSRCTYNKYLHDTRHNGDL